MEQSKEKVGEKLKNLRLSQRLTLEDVYRKTKIPIRILEAIEEDRPLDIAEVYWRGFIKIYCNFLKIDYNEILSYKQPSQKIELKKQKTFFIEKASKFPLRIKLFKKSYIFIGLVIFLILILTIQFRPKQKIAILPEKETTEEVKSIVWSKPIKVKIRAKQDCWVKAVVDGKVVFQSILKKGRFNIWEAKESVELSLGNASGIELYIDDKLFSTLGKSGQPIRRLLINKEGLQVIK